jgi:predicted DNA-binding transcriptional regulator YafY
MNRTDRMLAIMLHLQSRRYTRGEDLAERFEISVRTVYRDVQALCEAGVPVVATPGYGYTLMPGYFLPPLMLTPDEAGAILLGAAFVAAQLDAPYRQAVESARQKIEKLLPEATRDEVDFLQDTLRFVARVAPPEPVIEARLSTLRRSIQRRQVLRLTYQARHGEPGTRDVEPHGLISVGGRWIMAAYCRDRQAMRHFRLDRIDAVAPTGERFTRRTEFTVRRVEPMAPGPAEVRVLFASDVARWAREDRPMSFVAEEDHTEGVVMTFRPREPRDLLPWLLSWGASARVLDPPQLQRQIAVEARALADLYCDEPVDAR